ncbi:hypothetical protein NDU88_003881 [Pleurodeles waltl]|uniref:Uncharacterized protein n=1 Tax=Pleurodeles waltl TaxID=8319 RepID=A0AAV7V091_PLEWA|nr:hypothetical protein NDU88_003881 [Pleurodeles waltl]
MLAPAREGARELSFQHRSLLMCLKGYRQCTHCAIALFHSSHNRIRAGPLPAHRSAAPPCTRSQAQGQGLPVQHMDPSATAHTGARDSRHYLGASDAEHACSHARSHASPARITRGTQGRAESARSCPGEAGSAPGAARHTHPREEETGRAAQPL